MESALIVTPHLLKHRLNILNSRFFLEKHWIFSVNSPPTNLNPPPPTHTMMDMRNYYFKILITTGVCVCVCGWGGGVVNRTENIEQIHIYRKLRTLIFNFLASTILKSENIFVKLTFRTNSFNFVNLVQNLIVTNKKMA